MANNNDNIEDPSGTIQPGDLSKLLVEYRDAAHMDVEQIAEALCLTTSAINALESESFDKLPEPPYVRGYLRSYARLAEKDPSHIVDVYNTLRGEPTPDERTLHVSTDSSYHEVSKPIITPQRFRLGLLAALLLLLALLSMIPAVRNWTGNLWSSFSEPSEPAIAIDVPDADSAASLPSLTGDVPGNLPIDDPDTENTESKEPLDTPSEEPKQESETTEPVGNSDLADSTEETADPDSSNSEANEEQQASEDTTASNEEAGENAETTTSEEEAASDEESTAVGDTTLKLVFSDEVWLRIQDAEGKTIYQGLNPAGTEKELSVNTPVKFRVGNAPGLALFVNDEEMDISEFVRGSVANFGIE